MKKGKVLIIENGKTVIKLMGTHLETSGFEVVFARDGEKGFELCWKENPKTIILDMNLPGMDGWKVLRKLRENILTRDIPVIILSAALNKRGSGKRRDIENLFFVKKPFSLSELKKIFSATLKKRK